MERRDFLKGLGIAGGLAAFGAPIGAAAAESAPAAGGDDALAPQTRQAYRELLELLAEAQRRLFSPEWRVQTARDVIDGHHMLMRLVAAATDLFFDADPERPSFVSMVSPTRKFLGDNPDARYFLDRKSVV